MSALLVEVDGRVLRLDQERVYRVGRAIEADVVLTAGSVSRQHAEIRPDGDGWLLVDAGSQFGTFADGRRISEIRIQGRATIRCGPPAAGAEFVLTPAEQSNDASAGTAVVPSPLAPAPAPGVPTAPPHPVAPQAGPPQAPHAAPPPGAPVPGPAAGLDQTQVLAARPTQPPGAGAPGYGPGGPGGPPPLRTGPDLLLVAEGREYRFRHPARITIGRRTDSTVVLTDPSCSRQHGEVQAVPGGWTYANVSGEGTFADGRRVTTVRFDDRTVLRLGHPVAGPEVTMVPILSAAEEERRIARRRLRRRLGVVGAVAASLVLIVGIVVGSVLLLNRGGDDDPTAGGDGTTPTGAGELSEADLEAAKAATVKISAQSYLLNDPAQTPITYGGSGSILRSDGLILTNAHVAAPESPGIRERYGDENAIADPEYLLISVTDGMTDTSAPAEYRARVVEADGYLDVALLEIYADADGNELSEEPELPTIPVGTSDDLRAGDDVTVLGFPAVAGTGDSITVTTGVISTIINDPELGPRSELDTDARIAPGNSGGMAVDADGELIGIPTALHLDQSSPVTSGRIRSIDVVKDLIAEAEAATS